MLQTLLWIQLTAAQPLAPELLGWPAGRHFKTQINGPAVPLQVWHSVSGEVRVAASVPSRGQKRDLDVRLDDKTPRGIEALRFVTSESVSPWHLILVDDLPTHSISRNSDEVFLTLPGAVEGYVPNLTTRRHRFDLRRGQEVGFEVFASRLGSELDPWMRVVDPDGRVVAECDDAPSAGADSAVTLRIQKSGPHVVEIRDANHQGGPEFFYRLRCGKLQFLNTSFPPAASWQLHGSPKPLSSLQDLKKVEASWRSGSDLWAWLILAAGKSDAGAAIRVPLLRQSVLLEKEPNDIVNNPLPWDLKSAIAGRFLTPRDTDLFSFSVAAGESIRFKVRTREVGSPCDAFLQLENMDGTRLARAPIDGRTETFLTNRFAEAGRFVLRIEELNRRADSSFVYLLEAERLGPGLTMESEIDAVAIEPGGVAELRIKLSRRDLPGSVQFQIEGLASGFDAESLSVGEKLKDGVIRIRAAKDATPGSFSMIRIKSTVAGGDPIFCSTHTALAKRWPRMRQPPEFLDGWICVWVKAR